MKGKEYKENIEGSKDRNLFLFGENIGLLMGTLSLGLFSHSIILPIMKNNRILSNGEITIDITLDSLKISTGKCFVNV